MQSEDDKAKERFKNYLDTQWGPPAVVTMFRTLFTGGYPPLPVFTSWNIPNHIEIQDLVWKQVQTESFIDEIWPSLKMVLGNNVCNSTWTAQIATLMALFNVMRFLPMVLEED